METWTALLHVRIGIRREGLRGGGLARRGCARAVPGRKTRSERTGERAGLVLLVEGDSGLPSCTARASRAQQEQPETQDRTPRSPGKGMPAILCSHPLPLRIQRPYRLGDSSMKTVRST
jgi:hypothetical protein